MSILGLRTGSRPRVVELFAGAGLLGGAFKSVGFVIDAAYESDSIACQNYSRNIDRNIKCADLRSTQPVGSCDVLVAGPPCQGFSTLGARNANDPRNSLCLIVSRWSRVLSPQVVVVENVENFIGTEQYQLLVKRLRWQGYQVDSYLLNAVDFGVGQFRRRSFVIASRVGRVAAPKATRRKYVTVKEAWAGLASRPDGLNNHSAPRPSAIAKARMRVIPPGGDKRDIMRRAPELAPKSWWSTCSEVTDVWGRMLWNSPANTLRTCFINASKGRYIHPRQNRVMTLREAARLQSIPDRWFFKGTPYQVARQIGNGVPPRMGRAVARTVLLSLR